MGRAGNEISRDDTAPPQKKRRSLPAMLVAGAAAVAIGLSCWGAAVTDNTPRAALTAEQCAYLDAVSGRCWRRTSPVWRRWRWIP